MKLVSVVIPTRNRPDCLLCAVQIALRQLPDAEIIVSDNSDSDGLRHRLADEIASGRVRYTYSNEQLSVVDNFERTLQMATGAYIAFIGDDDSVGPGLWEIAEWAQREAVEAVVSYTDAFVASYFWPGVRSKYFGLGYSAKLFVNAFDGSARAIDGRQALSQVAARFGGGLGSLPRAYHGLVSRALLDRIRARHGHVFGGVSPDIFSATLITAECRKAYIVNYPFLVPGASAASTAGQGAERSDRAGLRDTDHISRFGASLRWDARIPEFYSPHTVWAYSMQKALDELPELRITPSYARLYARCLLFSRSYRAPTLQAVRHWAAAQGNARAWLAIAFNAGRELLELALRVGKRVLHPRPGGSATAYDDLPTMEAAYQALEQHIAARRITLQLPSSTGVEPRP